MFEHSERWHAAEDNPWVVLSFHPRILAHPSVIFTTTNNIYPACRRSRRLGRLSSNLLKWDLKAATAPGINAQKIWTRGPPTDRRRFCIRASYTCVNLQRIDVQMEESMDTIHGILSALVREISVRHAPEVFE